MRQALSYLLWSEFSFVQNYFKYGLWIQLLLPPSSNLGSPFLHIFIDFLFKKKNPHTLSFQRRTNMIKSCKKNDKVPALFLACPFSLPGEIDRDDKNNSRGYMIKTKNAILYVKPFGSSRYSSHNVLTIIILDMQCKSSQTLISTVSNGILEQSLKLIYFT